VAKRFVPTFVGMHVELVRWPSEEARLTKIREVGAARLVLVAEGIAPPLTTDVLEDWIRLPATDDDIRCRVRVLEDRLVTTVAEPQLPELDENGLLRMNGRWVPLPPVEQRLTAALLDRYRAVVSREAMARAGWPDGLPGRNVLDVHIVRLRRRLGPLGLVIRTVRSRGYLLEPGVFEDSSATAVEA
jgi:DNA-binding winged helix-turn-helix (wHTH) protein